MAQYFAKASDANVLSNFTHRFGVNDLTVVSDGAETAIRTVIGSSTRTFFSFDPPGSPLDVEVVMRCRITSTDAFTGVGGAIRVSGTGDANTNAYRSATHASDKYDLSVYQSGTYSSLARPTLSGVSTMAYHWQRLRIQGDQLKQKVWAGTPAEEPVAWTTELTNTQLGVAGWVGIFTFFATTNLITDIGVGTDGDTAPTSQPTNAVTVEAAAQAQSAAASASVAVAASAANTANWVYEDPVTTSRYTVVERDPVATDAQTEGDKLSTKEPWFRAFSWPVLNTTTGDILYFGAAHGDYPGNDVELYDPDAKTWTQLHRPHIPPDGDPFYSGGGSPNSWIDPNTGRVEPYSIHGYGRTGFAPDLGTEGRLIITANFPYGSALNGTTGLYEITDNRFCLLSYDHIEDLWRWHLAKTTGTDDPVANKQLPSSPNSDGLLVIGKWDTNLNATLIYLRESAGSWTKIYKFYEAGQDGILEFYDQRPTSLVNGNGQGGSATVFVPDLGGHVTAKMPQGGSPVPRVFFYDSVNKLHEEINLPASVTGQANYSDSGNFYFDWDSSTNRLIVLQGDTNKVAVMYSYDLVGHKAAGLTTDPTGFWENLSANNAPAIGNSAALNRHPMMYDSVRNKFFYVDSIPTGGTFHWSDGPRTWSLSINESGNVGISAAPQAQNATASADVSVSTTSIVIEGGFDQSNVNLSTSTVSGETVTINPRLTTTESDSNKWGHWMARLTNVSGLTPIIEVPEANNYLGVSNRAVWSYDRVTWQQFDNGSDIGTHRRYSNNTAFNQNTVYVAKMEPFSETEMAQWLTDNDANQYLHETGSSTAFGGDKYQFNLTRTGDLDEKSDPVPQYKMYTFRISNDAQVPDDGRGKRRCVVWGGVHAGETSGSHAAIGLANYLLAAGDAVAQRLLKNFDLYFIPVVNASGRGAGHFRGTFENNLNTNREIGNGTIDVITKAENALISDTGGTCHVGLDFHGWKGALYQGYWDHNSTAATKWTDKLGAYVAYSTSGTQGAGGMWHGEYARDVMGASFANTPEIGEDSVSTLTQMRVWGEYNARVIDDLWLDNEFQIPVLIDVLAAAANATCGCTAHLNRKSVRVNLVNASGTAQANLTNLKFALWDVSTPDLIADMPSANGSNGTTDGSGDLQFFADNSTLMPGQVGSLLVTDSDGNPVNQAASHAHPVEMGQE